ncbi:MAG: hypothetical protein ABH950_10080 [Candidatus Altiarchaeota archaeon]
MKNKLKTHGIILGMTVLILAVFLYLPSTLAFDVPNSTIKNTTLNASGGQIVVIDARNTTKTKLTIAFTSQVTNGWVAIGVLGGNSSVNGTFNGVNISASSSITSAINWTTIEIYYTTGDITTPENITETSLFMVTRATSADPWSAATPSNLSATDTGIWSGYVATNQTGFSQWALQGNIIPLGASTYELGSGWNLISLKEEI